MPTSSAAYSGHTDYDAPGKLVFFIWNPLMDQAKNLPHPFIAKSHSLHAKYAEIDFRLE